LANIALSVLDDHFEAVWNTHTNDTARVRYRRRGGATYRLVRYADDFVVMVFGTREHAVAIQGEVAGVLASMGLRLAPEKTRVVAIDEGFDFLGFHIQRHTQKGSSRSYVYSYPSKKSMTSIRRRIKTMTTQHLPIPGRAVSPTQPAHPGVGTVFPARQFQRRLPRHRALPVVAGMGVAA
jgi:RNA-directed DNA polymerase